jgi:hypothetical protein
MTLVVDMRTIASPHTGVCGMATAKVSRSDSRYACHSIYIGIVVVVRLVRSMMESYYSID